MLAAAGVDASNVARYELALLPVDPDASAQLLREALRERLGVDVGVVVTDTMGRPWRAGLTDVAIGVAGLTALTDPRGRVDGYGNVLGVTQVAVADEIAAAADLVKGKLAGIPVAVVRGLARDGKLADDGNGSRELIRRADEDLFRLGTAEAMAVGREDVGLGRRPAAARCTPTPSRPCSAHARADRPRVGGAAGVPRLPRRPPRRDVALVRARPPDRQRAGRRPVAGARAADPAPAGAACGCRSAGTANRATTRCSTPPPARPARRAASARCRSTRARSALDVHPITCSLGVPTRHFDVQYLAVASPGAEPVRSDESLDLQWFALGRAARRLRRPTCRAWSQLARDRLGA